MKREQQKILASILLERFGEPLSGDVIIEGAQSEFEVANVPCDQCKMMNTENDDSERCNCSN
jgi:hypothetical protein